MPALMMRFCAWGLAVLVARSQTLDWIWRQDIAPRCYLSHCLLSEDFHANPFTFGTRGVWFENSADESFGNDLDLILV
jgi:hypothetical protein